MHSSSRSKFWCMCYDAKETASFSVGEDIAAEKKERGRRGEKKSAA